MTPTGCQGTRFDAHIVLLPKLNIAYVVIVNPGGICAFGSTSFLDAARQVSEPVPGRRSVFVPPSLVSQNSRCGKFAARRSLIQIVFHTLERYFWHISLIVHAWSGGQPTKCVEPYGTAIS